MSHSINQPGTVKYVNDNKGFGFIARPNDLEDVFFHCSGLAGGLVFSTQLMEQRIVFDETLDQRSGRLRAINVRPAD